jgi:HTH-type transcriptional regulator/antitoxin HigA
MEIRPIKTDADYQKALKEIEELFDVAPGSAEADRLEVLTTLGEVYEDQNYQVPMPDPVEAIKYHMESRGLSPEDLEPIVGSRKLVNRRHPMSIDMIRKIHSGLGISSDVLIQPYSTVKSVA